MAVSDDRVTFWFGCNMLRHAEMIRLSIMLLERAGCDVNAVGGPAYCCGTAHDHEPRASSTMAARTVGRFNEAAATDGRDKVIIWCPSCHMHMSDIMAPGNTTHFDIAHLSEILSDRAAQLATVMTVPVRRRVLLHRHTGFATHVDVNSRVTDLLSRISGTRARRRAGPSRPHVQFAGCDPRSASRRRSGDVERRRCARLRHGLHDLSSLPSRTRAARWQGRHSCPQLGASRR